MNSKKDTAPPDLEMRVQTISKFGQTQLIYDLHSPTSAAPFTRRQIMGPTFQGSPEELHHRLLQQIEELGAGLDMDGALVLRPEVQRKLDGLGRELWHQLFNPEMRQAYRRFRDSVRTLLILSDEPWIPWEMIKPYDDQEDLLDDEFFADRFELTRWLAGDRIVPTEIVVESLACVALTRGLPQAETERRVVTDLTRSHTGLQDASPASPSVQTLITLLEKGGIDLLHFIGHGTFDRTMPNEAGIPLVDGSVFRPSDLHGPVRTQITKNRPMVFLNACSTGRQAWSWTGLGGWANRWVRDCGCGAFIGPHWRVRDSVGVSFAQAFYGSLARGETLGKAAKAARQAAREAVPGNPGWLAYAVYGHPNARVVFGQDVTSVTAWDVQDAPRSPPQLERPAAAAPRPVPSAAGVSPAISSNLRIKRRFTDRDRDRFVEESFDFIASFFESSLGALQHQNDRIETNFRRVDRNRFESAIYVDGEKECSCRVWMDRGHLGDIAYASGDSGPGNTYNETLSAVDDGYSQLLRTLGLRLFGSSDRKDLTQQEAAEYLWAMLIERLQR